MIKRLFLLFILFVGLSLSRADAATMSADAEALAVRLAQQSAVQLTAGGIDWKVGEWTSYNLTMAIAQGTMIKGVTEDLGDTFWMDMTMKLDFFGTPYSVLSKMRIRRADGMIIEFYVDGQKQEIPKQDVTLISQEADRITVPAGTFDCIHVKMTVAQDGQNSNVDTWINPRDVALDGMIKTVQEGGLMGATTLELTGFGEKNPPR